MEHRVKEIKEGLGKIQEEIHSLQMDFRNLRNPNELLGELDRIELGLYCIEIGDQLIQYTNTKPEQDMGRDSLAKLFSLIKNHINSCSCTKYLTVSSNSSNRDIIDESSIIHNATLYLFSLSTTSAPYIPIEAYEKLNKELDDLIDRIQDEISYDSLSDTTRRFFWNDFARAYDYLYQFHDYENYKSICRSFRTTVKNLIKKRISRSSTCVGQKSGGNLIDNVLEPTNVKSVYIPVVSKNKGTHSDDIKEVISRKRGRKEDSDDDYEPVKVSKKEIHAMKIKYLEQTAPARYALQQKRLGLVVCWDNALG